VTGLARRAARAAGISAAAAALLFTAMPASAADPAQITCPVDALSDKEREQLADHVRRQSSAEEPVIEAFHASVTACLARHGWSQQAARLAVVHNLATIGQREARLGLERLGVDVAPIERLLLADRAAVDSARSEASSDALTAFYEGLDPAMRRSIESRGGNGAELLGTFLLFRAAMETSRADFAAE
jgi:hypothetical protein